MPDAVFRVREKKAYTASLLVELAQQIRVLNRRITPIDTGQLRKSLQIQKERDALVVRWTAPYAAFTTKTGWLTEFMQELDGVTEKE